MKNCSVCHRLLPLESFCLNKRAPDGHTARCLKCRRAQMAAWRDENREYVTTYQREYKQLMRARAEAKKSV